MSARRPTPAEQDPERGDLAGGLPFGGGAAGAAPSARAARGPRVYSVSEITGEIRRTLEGGFQDVTVEGEISNFRPSAAGHLYFSLKDSEAIISAVMFRNRLWTLRFQPADGMKVRARGNLSVYPKRGNYQLICENLLLAGEGNLLQTIEERKRRLAAEGLFDPARKRPLPLFPARVAVVTSPTGAAIRDILRVLKRRAAGIDVVVLPALVQGQGAAEQIAAQIEVANRFDMADVLIVGRGGGSLEDLLPFSEEITVRAVAASRIPVISAVGHEVDTALTDLAADVRAPTPSVAAEMVSASREDLARKVRVAFETLRRDMQQRLARARMILEQFAPESLERNFRLLVQPLMQRLDDARAALAQGVRTRARDARHRHELATHDLIAASPLAILERGYAVVTRQDTGEVVRSAESVGPGDELSLRVAKGRIDADVKETHPDAQL
jgi:exodeoxyribonuclease VII large subunit